MSDTDAECVTPLPEAEAVVARLGESRASEFRNALAQAPGLDPELRDGLYALLTSPSPGLGRPPRDPSYPTSPPAGPPPTAAGGTRLRACEAPLAGQQERRARSAAPVEELQTSSIASKARAGMRPSEHRRSSSAAPAHSTSIIDGVRAAARRDPDNSGPPPRTAPAGAPRRRISEERRAKSALGMAERCSSSPSWPEAPTLKAAAQDHDDMLSHFLQERGVTDGTIDFAHLRPTTALDKAASPLGWASGLLPGGDCTVVGTHTVT